MGILGKLFGEKAPEWAQPISREDFQEFRDYVIRALAQFDIRAEIDWEEGRAFVNGDTMRLGFHNLIRTWLNQESHERQDAVEHFLQVLVTAMAQRVVSLEEDAALLRPRIVDGMELEGLAEVASARFGNNLHTVLVVDQGEVMKFVQREEIEKTGKSFQYWFDLAIANLAGLEEPSVSHKSIPLGRLTIIGQECFGAARIYLLDRFMDPGRAYLVMAPSRDSLIVFDPHEANFQTVSWLLGFGYKVYDDVAEYRNLPFIFQYCNGTFKDLTAWDGERVVVRLDSLDAAAN